MNVAEFKRLRPNRRFSKCSLGGYICLKYITPYMSSRFISRNIRPNFITLLMIISGLVWGAVLLIPSVYCKLLCFFGYLLWFAFDCSDGEVARFTKQFSKYGEQLDWVAHLLCHPLFVFGMYISIEQFYRMENSAALLYFSIAFMVLELIHRSLIPIYFRDNVDDTRTASQGECSLVKKIIAYTKYQIGYFPNYVIFMPLLLFVDVVAGLSIFPYIYLFFAFLYCLYVIKEIITVTVAMYKS